ncbi:hypothetical protein BDV96DRAFT_628618 [Lophiotrema nucula]|uniref:CorA-like transporter domain-containing protein n=1 Tax=Lophiotrema nucula TaxID=690887 RepID=A0A6A5ZL21_9PLEO|nr:hypothetical protein BDV96DRAFT_628618 [Lophiotrema nucula]
MSRDSQLSLNGAFLAPGSNAELDILDLHYDSNVPSFFHQISALRPLNITYAMLKVIVDYFEMSHYVYNMARCFEGRSESIGAAYCPPLRVQDLCYLYKYAANKHGKYAYPWVIRQTGVYQSYDKRTKRSVWLVMNSNSDFSAKSQILECLLQSHGRTQMANHPLWLHTILLTRHILSWSGYCNYYESSLEEIYNDVATTELDSPQFLDHGMTLRTSALEKRFLPLPSIFQSWKRLLDGLRSMQCSWFDDQEEQVATTFRNVREEISAHSQNSAYMLDLARSVRQQISDTLSLKKQHVSQETSNGVATLTKHTASDSRAVRNITIVTLFYLPFSFVATFMGMNFFAMDAGSKEVQVSRRLWIYFLIAVPLTGITIMFTMRDMLRTLLGRIRYVPRVDEERVIGHNLAVLAPQ